MVESLSTSYRSHQALVMGTYRDQIISLELNIYLLLDKVEFPIQMRKPNETQNHSNEIYLYIFVKHTMALLCAIE